jgi:hypothetical protein
MQRAKGMSVKINSKASLLTHTDPKLMITSNMLILFYVDFVHKKTNKVKQASHGHDSSSEDEWNYEEIEKQT